MKTPTWGQLEGFCKADAWRSIRSTKHVFYEKVLPDGSVLQTHVSHAREKTMSENTFRAILRHQLRVSVAAFWHSVRTGKPASRPSAPLPETRPGLPASLVWQLKRELGLGEEGIAGRSSPSFPRRSGPMAGCAGSPGRSSR